MIKYFKIGEVSEIKNIDAQTLRYYDRLGILVPEYTDEENGYRYYSIKQFIDVDRIKFCRRIGLSLEETKEFMNSKNLDFAVNILKEKRDVLENEINRLETIRKDVDGIIYSIDLLYKDHDQVNQISLTEKKCFYGILDESVEVNNLYDFEMHLRDLTNQHPMYSEVGHNFGLVSKFEFDEYIKNGFMGNSSTILHVAKQFKDEANVKEFYIGKCVVTYHTGSKAKHINLDSEILDIIEKNNLKIRGDIYVFPIINRFIVDEEKEYVYEIIIPVTNIDE